MIAIDSAIVVEARQGPDAARDLQLLVDGTIDEIASVDLTIAETALDAWRRFGKGRHPAGLNYGDCFAYALSRSRREIVVHAAAILHSCRVARMQAAIGVARPHL